MIELRLELALALSQEPHDAGCSCPDCEPDGAPPDDELRGLASYERAHSPAVLG